MVKFVIVALCVTAAIATANTQKSETPLKFGMQMANRGLKVVCWYEYLKVFPHTDSDSFGDCYQGAEHISAQVDNPSKTNKAHFDLNPDKKETFFGKQVPTFMSNLPSEYGDKCNQYAATPKAAPTTNESDALNDGGKDYIYKAFSYCLMKTLRSRHGDKAIDAVKKEKTHSLKPWMQTLLDRENEFRAYHGASPLQLVKNLSDAAQSWADTGAKNCEFEHSPPDSSKYKGEDTGESLSGGFGDPADSAYQAIDGWYEEIKDYPFPKGYQGKGGDDLFLAIGHFTQSIWKGTKYVGYGYQYNAKCGHEQSAFIVARYFPAGNGIGEFVKNVQPPPR